MIKQKILSLQDHCLLDYFELPGTGVVLVNQLIGFGNEANLYLGSKKGHPVSELTCEYVIKAHLALESLDSNEDLPNPEETITIYRALLKVQPHPGLNLPLALCEDNSVKEKSNQLEQPDMNDEDDIEPKIAFFTIYPKMEHSLNHVSSVIWTHTIPDLNFSIEQLFSGLAHLNDNGVLYSDFAIRNILYSPEHGLQLCDFGCSEIIASTSMQINERTSQAQQLNDLLFEHILESELRCHTNFPIPNNKHGGQKRKLIPYNYSQDPTAQKLIGIIQLLLDKYPMSYDNSVVAQELLTIAKQLIQD